MYLLRWIVLYTSWVRLLVEVFIYITLLESKYKFLVPFSSCEFSHCIFFDLDWLNWYSCSTFSINHLNVWSHWFSKPEIILLIKSSSFLIFYRLYHYHHLISFDSYLYFNYYLFLSCIMVRFKFFSWKTKLRVSQTERYETVMIVFTWD